MAHIDDGGGKRSAAVDINIVPFIDLMSVLIIFLLVSAVWTQVSMIQIGASLYSKKNNEKVIKPPPHAEVIFRVDIRKEGYRVKLGKNERMLAKVKGEYDRDGLLKFANKVKIKYTEKVDVTISMTESLAYKALIEGMDVLLESGFPEIAIATSEAR